MLDNNLPKVSIIVPVYNLERYLKQCIESLLRQTYNNIELILVDDGSTDDCPRICDSYTLCDPRIHAIHKTNGGSSSAREAGIQESTGEYIMIVDGDDWLDADTVATCVHRAKADNADCVMFSYIKEYPKRSIPVHTINSELKLDKADAERMIHRRLIGPLDEELAHPEKVDSIVSVCMKLYRREVAKKGRIVSERIVGTSEDTVFNIYALEDCRITYLDRCFYHYRKTNTASITSSYKPDLAEKWDALYEMIGTYVKQRDNGENRYQSAFLNRVACCMIGLGLNEINSGAGFSACSKRIKEIIGKSLYKEAFEKLNVKPMPLKWKIFFAACRFRFGAALVLMLRIMNRLRSRISD